MVSDMKRDGLMSEAVHMYVYKRMNMLGLMRLNTCEGSSAYFLTECFDSTWMTGARRGKRVAGEGEEDEEKQREQVDEVKTCV